MHSFRKAPEARQTLAQPVRAGYITENNPSTVGAAHFSIRYVSNFPTNELFSVRTNRAVVRASAHSTRPAPLQLNAYLLFLPNLRGHLLHLRVDQPVRRQNSLAAQNIRLPFQVADLSTGLFQNHHPSRRIPCLQSKILKS